MTSSSTPRTRSHTKDTSKKSSNASANTNSMLNLKCVSSIPPLSNTLASASPEGLTMALEKVQAVCDWPEPRKVKDIQSFLGFTNFYHCFINNYSDIVIPLMHLTCKNAPWNFSNECCSSFNSLKEAFTSTPILTHWVPDVPIMVETDTSDYTITGILSITCSDRELHPISFYSCTLTTLELNYHTHNKELLTIYEVFRHW